MRDDGHGAHPLLPCWVDGRLLPPGEPLPPTRIESSAHPSCYTTARVRGDRSPGDLVADWQTQHVERLQRDVALLGLGRLDENQVTRAFADLTHAAFGTGTGIVRLEARAGLSGRAHLIGVARALGDNPDTWRASISSVHHPGPHPLSRAKLSSDPHLTEARRERDAAAMDEALLVDRSGYLVEGTRTNVIVVTASGDLQTPDLERGGVQGIARDIVLRNLGELRCRHIAASGLQRAREIIAINAVRGARPITELNGLRIGNGSPGPWAARIAGILTPG